jgi:putative glutamine amidotransferase
MAAVSACDDPFVTRLLYAGHQATLPAAAPTLIGVKPRIGISSAPSFHDGRRAEHLERAYTDAVVGADALPFVVPVLDRADAEEVVFSLDGLLLTGGGDVAAGFYEEEPAREAYGVDAARDTWELALAAAARTAGLPVLGVCRGAQVLNVAAGGTLIQHLPSRTDEPHREYERDRESVHPVEVEPGSLLAAITGQRSFGVNSMHHQAVANVGSSLRPVAWAPDGVIEAVESNDDRPLLGVQWHPELITHQPPHGLLFVWLAQAAAHRQGATESAPTRP